MSQHRILTKLHLVALFLWIVMKYQPEERASSLKSLVQQCQYDTTILCPGCFPRPVNCSFFENLKSIDSNELFEELLTHFNQHGVRYGTLSGSEQRVVIKNLNKEHGVEELISSICNDLKIYRNCRLRNKEPYLKVLRQRVLNDNQLEGAILCPLMDEEALKRFLFEIDENDLNKILLMRINAQPLLLKLLQERNFPVPKLIFQGGFTLVESYEGEALAKYYDRPLNVRLLIANELIKASLNFTAGVDNFRFYLTDINPDNIVVRMSSEEEIKVTFVDLNNVIILDSHSKRLKPSKQKHVHSRIDCDGCFAYIQEDICVHQISDINLFAVCQLLLENLNGDSKRGFLHSLGTDSKQEAFRKLLHQCVYCQPPYCEDRQEVLQRIMEIIHDVLHEVV